MSYRTTVSQGRRQPTSLSPGQRKALTHAARPGQITVAEAAKVTSWPEASARRMLDGLVQDRALRADGRGGYEITAEGREALDA